MGAGGPSLHCTISTEGAPSLRFLQEPALSLSKGWAAMPAQLLSALHYPLCMPPSYPPLRLRSGQALGHQANDAPVLEGKYPFNQLLHSFEVHDPIRFPGFATVG